MNSNLGIPGIAELIGVTVGSVKLMKARGNLPDPDVIVDGVPRLWSKATIVEWDSQRPKRYDNRKKQQ